VRGFFPRYGACEPHTNDGAYVRVWLRTGLPQLDELEGILRALDDQKLVLRHALFGDLTFGRARLLQLRPLFHGRRIELDNARHHLGEAGHVVPNLVPPRAEGPSLRHTFRMDAVPPSAQFVLTVHHLKPAADGGEIEVLVNGQRIDSLNRQAGRVVKDAVRTTVAIPVRVLRIGENTIELRQVPDATVRRANCVVSDLAIEVPR
jgi:hypothetical protein